MPDNPAYRQQVTAAVEHILTAISSDDPTTLAYRFTIATTNHGPVEVELIIHRRSDR